MALNRLPSLIEWLIDLNVIGNLVAFVCGPRAAAINGAARRVDSGLLRSVF